jgi:hypothetical protein
VANDTWKKNERALAARLGGKRIGPTGKTGSDVAHPLFAIECKHRKNLPEWLYEAQAQSCGAARPEQLPIVVWHKLGDRHDGDLVVMRLKDFEAWAGTLPSTGEEASE